VVGGKFSSGASEDLEFEVLSIEVDRRGSFRVRVFIGRDMLRVLVVSGKSSFRVEELIILEIVGCKVLIEFEVLE
jgi:hypothetical protein